MTDHSQMKLGKLARRHDRRTLDMARYMTPPLPAAPSKVDYTQGITDWGMMLNDQLSCCTIAAVGHAVQVWTANAGRESTVPDSTILSYYEQWNGYNPSDASTDRGGVELDVLNHWRQEGFLGHSLDAFVSVDLSSGSANAGARLQVSGVSTEVPRPRFQAPTAREELASIGPDTRHLTPDTCSLISTAIWLFGGAYLGVNLPIAAQKQDVWDVPENPGLDDEPGSWGGHAVYLVGYEKPGDGTRDTGAKTGARDPGLGTRVCGLPGPQPPPSNIDPPSPYPVSRIPHPGFLTCITWGQAKKMTWAWLDRYCDEAYALVSCDFIESNGASPSGFNFATLEEDLKLVTA